MKKVVQKIQKEATDEQKMFYALIASASVAVTLIFLWVASFGTSYSSLKNIHSNFATGDYQGAGQENKQKASAIESLKTTFFELRGGKKQELPKNKKEFKRQPVEIEI